MSSSQGDNEAVKNALLWFMCLVVVYSSSVSKDAAHTRECVNEGEISKELMIRGEERRAGVSEPRNIYVL